MGAVRRRGKVEAVRLMYRYLVAVHWPLEARHPSPCWWLVGYYYYSGNFFGSFGYFFFDVWMFFFILDRVFFYWIWGSFLEVFLGLSGNFFVTRVFF